MQIAILIFEKLTALDAIGPYEVLRSVPGWEVKFVAPEKGQVRTDSGALGLSADYSLDEVERGGHRPRPRRRRQPPAAGATSGPRLAAQDRRRQQVDDLGLHRLAGARRRRPARGQARDLQLALPRPSRRIRGRAGRRPLRRGRQADHRRRRHRRDRHGAAPGRARGRPRGRPGDPARARVRPAAPLRLGLAARRRPPRSSSWSKRWPASGRSG